MSLPTSGAAAARLDTVAAAATLRTFLSDHAAVWVWEDGRRLARLAGEPAGYALSAESGRLVCHFWSSDLNLVRRVGAISAAGGRLRLQCYRMGQAHPTTLVLEPTAMGAGGSDATAARAEFREAVAAAARREWPEWTLAARPSLPGAAQRLLLRRQRALVACIAVADGDDGAGSGALAQAMLWAGQACARHPDHHLAGLRLILPEAAAALTEERRPWLRADIPITMYRFDRSAGRLDAMETRAADGAGTCDPGRLFRARNADSEPVPPAVLEVWAEMRELCPQVALEAGPEGWYFRLYGLELAREAREPGLGAAFVYGCGRERSPLTAATWPLFRDFLREAGEQRVPGGRRQDAWYARQPERWMEHLLRHDLAALDAACDPRFLYTQVPLYSGGGRDVLDLLALDRRGRLLVIELKASEDVDFPLQGLDYWWRVRHRQLAGDFERLGYFPGCQISPLPPLLWLVAPALRWHPQTDAVLRWLGPEVPWHRIEINEEWRQRLQVVCRKESCNA